MMMYFAKKMHRASKGKKVTNMACKGKGKGGRKGKGK